MGWEEVDRLDQAAYRAITRSRSPRLDRVMAGLTRAADHSKLSLGAALLMSAFGGREGRGAAIRGLVCVGATAVIVNAAVKPVSARRRPDRSHASARFGRVRMPISRSFPSGHTAAAFAFARGAGEACPQVAPPLYLLAALVGYSRIHTGVHYPLDVLVGAGCGLLTAELAGRRIAALTAVDNPPTGLQEDQ